MSRRGSSHPPVSLFAFQDIITSVAGIIIFLTLMMAVELIQARQTSPQVQTQEVILELEQGLPGLEAEIARLEELLASQQQQLDLAAQATPSQLATSLTETTEQIATIERELAELRRHQSSLEANRDSVSAALTRRKLDQAALEELKAKAERMKQQLEQLKQSNRVIYTRGESGKTAWLVEISGTHIQAMRAGDEAVAKTFGAAKIGELMQWMKSLNARTEYVILVIKPSAVELFDMLESQFDQLSLDIGFDLIEEQQTVMPGPQP